MIYIGNFEILTAKSAIYLGNVGSNGGLIYTEGDSRSFADMIFAFFTNLVSENHPSRFWPSERISRTAASNSSIACSAAVSFIATIRS